MSRQPTPARPPSNNRFRLTGAVAIPIARRRIAGKRRLIALLVPLLSAVPVSAMAAGDDEPWRETATANHRIVEGHASSAGDRRRDADRAAAGEVIGAPAPTAAHFRHHDALFGDAWIADITTVIRDDRDGDGFFSSVELTIDADTELTTHDVYASIVMTDAEGYETLRHDTLTFALHGRASSDAYRVEIELLGNHEADWRDIHIELRDARDDFWLDDVSAITHTSLASLPLESVDLDRPIRDDDHPGAYTDTDVVIVSVSGEHDAYDDHDTGYVAAYAGAGSTWGLASLLGLLFSRLITRRNRADSL